ncbi:hypothetical protein [Butyrivibrio hungatei]|nr:hypothetical protein [Butyrivibrio hungatei]
MDYIICKSCNMLFRNVDTHNNLCPECKKRDDDSYKKVTEYISENPAADGETISIATGVDLKTIKRWVVEKRITIAGNLGLSTCRTCGEPIYEGRLCDRCKNSLLNGYMRAGAKKAASESAKINPSPAHTGGMHFLR